MSSTSEPAQAYISQTPSVVFNDSQITIREGEDSSSTLETIRGELMSLSVRQVEVRRRIQHIRHALVELVHVFGPEILTPAVGGGGASSQSLSRSGVRIIDLTRKALSQSGQWLSLYELIELIRQESTTALIRFINPGVAVSNALRVLRRQGEVEVSRDKQFAKWRWSAKQNIETRRSSHQGL